MFFRMKNQYFLATGKTIFAKKCLFWSIAYGGGFLCTQVGRKIDFTSNVLSHGDKVHKSPCVTMSLFLHQLECTLSQDRIQKMTVFKKVV